MQKIPQNILIILANPDPRSFSHTIARQCQQQLNAGGYRVNLHDLYAENFDPVLPAGEISRSANLPPVVENHCRQLTQASGLIIIHPNWWGQPPAILKGWLDRVIRPNVAYRFLPQDSGEGIPEGLLKARAALVFNTSNTPVEREMRVFGDPLEQIWIKCILNFCGIHNVYRKNFGVMVTSTEEQRQKWITEVSQALARFFPPLSA